MTPSRLRRVLVVVFLLLLVGCVSWAWDEYGKSCQRWTLTSRETAACRQLAAALEQDGRQASVSEGAELPEAQLYDKVHLAAQAAGLASEQQVIRSIRPQASHAVHLGADEASHQRTVEVSLQGLTMEQLVAFLYHLQSDPPQVQIVAITLHEPKGLGTASLWNVEPLVLGYHAAGTAGLAQDAAHR